MTIMIANTNRNNNKIQLIIISPDFGERIGYIQTGTSTTRFLTANGRAGGRRRLTVIWNGWRPTNPADARYNYTIWFNCIGRQGARWDLTDGSYVPTVTNYRVSTLYASHDVHKIVCNSRQVKIDKRNHVGATATWHARIVQH